MDFNLFLIPFFIVLCIGLSVMTVAVLMTPAFVCEAFYDGDRTVMRNDQEFYKTGYL